MSELLKFARESNQSNRGVLQLSDCPNLGDHRPLLSIITPTYNSLHFLQETVESVITIDLDMEWIVVDDGSTDGTVAFLQNLSKTHKWIALIINSVRAGSRWPNYALGLSRSRGTFVIFLDHDDVLIPSVVKSTVHALMTTSKAQLAISRVAYMDAVSAVYKVKSIPFVSYGRILPGRFLFWLIFLLPTYPTKHGAVIARRSLFALTGPIFDIGFVLAASRVSDVLLMPEVGLRYRNLATSISSRRTFSSEGFWWDLINTFLPSPQYRCRRQFIWFYRVIVGLAKQVYSLFTAKRI